MNRNFLKAAGASLVAAGALVTAPANAVATDYSTLTTAVDWSSAITAIMAVAAIIAGVFVTYRGISFVLRMIKGG